MPNHQELDSSCEEIDFHIAQPNTIEYAAPLFILDNPRSKTTNERSTPRKQPKNAKPCAPRARNKSLININCSPECLVLLLSALIAIAAVFWHGKLEMNHEVQRLRNAFEWENAVLRVELEQCRLEKSEALQLNTTVVKMTKKLEMLQHVIFSSVSRQNAKMHDFGNKTLAKFNQLYNTLHVSKSQGQTQKCRARLTHEYNNWLLERIEADNDISLN